MYTSRTDTTSSGPQSRAGTPAGPLHARVRAGVGHVLPDEPVLRNGHLLAFSSLLSAALGAGFWFFATHWYDDDLVGLNYSALSTSMLLASIGQLNLNDFLIRFVPSAGRHTRRLVLTCYLVSACWSALVAVGFLALVPEVAPGLDFLLTPLTGACFVAATAGYAIFVMQDGALTGVRRPGWVVAENIVFAAAKILLLAIGAALTLFTGILLSWAGALAVALLVANFLLLRRAVPRHEAEATEAPPPPRMVGFAAADYFGSLFRMAAYTLVPLLVLNSLGAKQSAYFSLAWIIGYIPFLFARNMGSSLVVEAVRCPERLVEHGLRVLRHTGLFLLVGVGVIVVTAPQILAFFGPGYSEEGSTLLRLLALSALPNLLFSVAVDVARARRRLRWAVALQMTLCALVLGLSQALLPSFGVTGAGIAWLAAECTLALPLLLLLRRWLIPAPGRPS